MRALILGCGYVGLPLGAALVRQGHTVFGVRRSEAGQEALQREGITPLAADVARAEDWAKLPEGIDWVIFCVSSSRGGLDAYREVYLGGTRNLIGWLRSHPCRKLVYTSSTSVYGQTDGSAVKETHPTQPLSETSQVLVETERLLIEAGERERIPAVILRLAGIYGPDRGHLFQQFLQNAVKIPGQGERIINMIHLDDVVGVMLAALRDGRPGAIYNAVDDEPVTQLHFFRWLAETLGKWMPPFASADAGPGGTERKRGLTNKRVLNRRLTMELGYRFKYPTFRQGYTAEIRRLEAAGLLNIEPEPR
jgi:nucleoside-diphosphate-sugar epimerase